VSARTGDTIAILFNTEYDTESAPESALLDASVGNVDIQITDSLGHTEFVVPRAVIEAPAALGSLAVGADLESLTGLVAVFDLPDPWPNGAISFPNTFTLVVQYAGAATFGGNDLEVLGEGGTPLSLTAATPLSALELQPMLRLRPAWDRVATEGFDPNWTIGGIEFTLRYMASSSGDIDQLTVVSNGEATSGLAMANPLAPEGSDKLWKVMLLHPDGFDLPDKGCDGTGRCFAGRWSLLDLAFQKDITGVPSATPVFVASDFSIEDLRVVDLGGVQLNPPYTGERFFHSYVTNNFAVPEPGFSVLLMAGVFGLLGLERIRRRAARLAERTLPFWSPWRAAVPGSRECFGPREMCVTAQPVRTGS
jgi:hypothetical protein